MDGRIDEVIAMDDRLSITYKDQKMSMYAPEKTEDVRIFVEKTDYDGNYEEEVGFTLKDVYNLNAVKEKYKDDAREEANERNSYLEREAKSLRHDKRVLEARNSELEKENKSLRDAVVQREIEKK